MDIEVSTFFTKWSPLASVFQTRLGGPVTHADVAVWRQQLEQEELLIPEHAQFAVLLDLRGFAPVDIPAHKAMRTVIPAFLARHGLRPAFIDLFDERPEMQITCDRDARCVAFANVHHDETKMANYEQRIGRNDQRFFTDLAAAERWLESRAHAS